MTTTIALATVQTMSFVVQRLARKRLPLEDEKETQRAIAVALAEEPAFIFEREAHVQGGIIDFLVATPGPNAEGWAVGIEVKLKGGAGAIGRQLRAYAKEPAIKALIFVTAKPIVLADHINGKPLVTFNLGRGWL